VRPRGIRVARYLCGRARTTISLLPKFLCSRFPGELDEIEQALCEAEGARSVERVAGGLRPQSTLRSGVRWLRRRLTPVRGAIRTIVAALMPELRNRIDARSVVRPLREHLGTRRALVQLREIAGPRLSELSYPIGLVPFRREREDSHTKWGQISGEEHPRFPIAVARGQPNATT
jgi:hypothetical protein